jgi:hypothetical protein
VFVLEHVSLTVEETQALLNPDEALVLLVPTSAEPPIPEETFVWVVTKTEMRWVRSDFGTALEQREVMALRCGLDYDGSWATKDTKCPDLTKSSSRRPMPGSLNRCPLTLLVRMRCTKRCSAKSRTSSTASSCS